MAGLEQPFFDIQSTEHSNMVLHQPENKHVFKAFDLTGKVAVVTGISSPNLYTVYWKLYI